MKAIIQTHSQELGTKTFTIKGKHLDVCELGTGGYSVVDKSSRPYKVRGVFHSVTDIQVRGNPKKPPVDTNQLLNQITEAISKTDLSSHICEGFLKAEQITDERSQARWACESNPVATAHPNFDAFINSKITPQDCAEFGVRVARTERDINLERALQAEQRLAQLEGDIDTDALPQAMQDREMLYARITKMQEVISLQRQSTPPTDSYMRGMLNGLLLAEGCMLDQEPVYMESPTKPPFEVRTTVNAEGQTFIAGMGVGVADDTALPAEPVEVPCEEPSTSKKKAKDIKDEFVAWNDNKNPGDPTPV